MSSLIPIFRDKLIPWAQNDLDQRLIVARPVMKKTAVPYGVELSRKKIPGKCILVRARDDGPQKIVRARWPEAGLHETYPPKLVCVVKGKTDYQAGEYIITCGEGHFLLLPPFTPNFAGGRSHLEGKNRQYGSCDLVQLILMRDYVRCASCSSRGEEHREGNEYFIFQRQTLDFFRLFMEEARHRQEGSEILLSHALAAAFVLMWREINESGRESDSSYSQKIRP